MTLKKYAEQYNKSTEVNTKSNNLININKLYPKVPQNSECEWVVLIFFWNADLRSQSRISK